MNRTPLKKRIAFSAAIWASLTLLLAAAGEVYVRHFYQGDVTDPGDPENRPLQYAPSLFSRHVLPRKEQEVVKWGRRLFRVNRHGFRGSDFPAKKPEGEFRIMVFGGSAVFLAGEEGELAWPQMLEERLHQAGLSRAGVINAGAPGHASFDSFGRLFAEGHLFEPDYVILYNAWNDLKYFKSDEPLLRAYKPYRPGFDYRLYYTGPFDRFLGSHSKLYLLMREFRVARKLNLGREGTSHLREPPATGLPAGEQNEGLKAAGLKQYRINLVMFVEMAMCAGAKPVLMTQARLVSPGNTPEERNRIRYGLVSMDHEELCTAFRLTDETVFQVAREKQVEVIDASREMTGKASYFLDHVHLTAEGAAKIAGITAERIHTIINDN